MGSRSAPKTHNENIIEIIKILNERHCAAVIVSSLFCNKENEVIS
jgi:hypothetical protein